jgi:hypothetical protein
MTMKTTIYYAVLLICLGWVQSAAALPISTIGFMPTGANPATAFSANTLKLDVLSKPNSYSVDLMVRILPKGQQAWQIVSAYDVDVRYTSTVTSSTGVTFGNSLGNPFAQPLPEVLQKSSVTVNGLLGTGVVNLKAGSLLDDADLRVLQSSSLFAGNYYITLATLTFDALATGSSTLLVDWSNAQGFTRDVKGLSSLGQDNYYYADPILPDSQEVPEPGTLLLTGAGILALMVLRLRAVARKRFTM